MMMILRRILLRGLSLCKEMQLTTCCVIQVCGEMDVKTEFGKVLREAREATGLSQESFADAVGMDRTTISLIERGKQSPTIETVWRLAEKLDATPSELLKRLEELIDD